MHIAPTQPKNFGFDEEALALKDVACKFFQDNLPTQSLHALVAADSDLTQGTRSRWDPALWDEIVELGWLSVAVPEHLGGAGLSATAVAGLLEEAGRAALPSPLVSTLGVTYILKACDTKSANRFLTDISRGVTFSYASCDRNGSWGYSSSEVVLENNTLNGASYFVQEAQKVDYFLVNAKQEGKTVLVCVPADAEGLIVEPNAILDLTRDQSCVCFDGVKIDPEQIVASINTANDAIQQATPALLVLISADICGAAEWQLQTTAEYARTRTQFDRNLGFFQAVKHPLVEFMIALDLARALLYNAACAIDHEPQNAEKYARMAKAAANDAAAFGSKKSVQLHGGIGFTWECYVHIYLKRQMHSQTLLGDATQQRRELANIVLAEP